MRQHNRDGQPRSQEYYTQIGLDEIRRIQTRLEIGEATATVASQLFTQLRDDGLTGRCIEAIATACLYAGIRMHDLAHTLGECVQLSPASRHQVETALKTVSEKSPLNPQSATPFLTRLLARIECRPDVVRTARRLLTHVEQTAVVSGRPPQTVAAATLYAAGQLVERPPEIDTPDTATLSEPTPLTQQAIADTADLSRRTVSVGWDALQDHVDLDSWE